jgi:hypothetical protein
MNSRKAKNHDNHIVDNQWRHIMSRRKYIEEKAKADVKQGKAYAPPKDSIFDTKKEREQKKIEKEIYRGAYHEEKNKRKK